MGHVTDLIKDLRSAARALETLTDPPPQTAEDRQKTAAVIGRARTTLHQLTNIGAEPDDYEVGSKAWKSARQAADGRRILANALSIAAQSMFTAADPIAVRRDLGRAVRGLIEHARLEEALVGGGQSREVA